MNVLETERTVVDRISLDDAPFFVELVNTPDWIRFIGDRGVSSNDDARRFLQNGFLESYREHRFGYYVVKSRPSRVAIGICGFLKKPTLRNPDFGFALLPNYYGKGLAVESCSAVLNYGIQTFGFTELDAVTAPDNLRSIRLLKKLSFHRIGAVDGDSSEAGVQLYRWHSAAEHFNSPEPDRQS